MKLNYIISLFVFLIFQLVISNNCYCRNPVKIIYVDSKCTDDRNKLYTELRKQLSGNEFVLFLSNGASPEIFTDLQSLENCFSSGGNCRGLTAPVSYIDDCKLFYDVVTLFKKESNVRLFEVSSDLTVVATQKLIVMYFLDFTEGPDALNLFILNFKNLLIEPKNVNYKIMFDSSFKERIGPDSNSELIEQLTLNDLSYEFF